MSSGYRSEDSAIEARLRDWLRTVDDHRLWSEMLATGSYPMLYGWLLENYFYLSAAARHACAAIAACTDGEIRKELLKHLEEEAEHGDLLRVGLDEAGALIDPDDSRPLPTTIAFVECLRELGAQDWKAYCLALGFLQFSLSADDPRHSSFYRQIEERCPETAPLLRAVKSHDELDQKLGHGDHISHLLRRLGERHALEEATFSRAAIVPQLVWSFLDGIRTHYGAGLVAIAQRQGWSM